LHPLWTKLVAKYNGGNTCTLHGGGGTQHRDEKTHVGVGRLSSPCEESKAVRCLGETRSKLTLKVSPRQKLISNSQACPVSGDCQLLIYQPLTGQLLRTCLLQRPHPMEEAWAQTPRAKPPQSCPIGKSNIRCHANQHTNLKKGQSWSKPL
jgi:hypothetical protein